MHCSPSRQSAYSKAKTCYSLDALKAIDSAVKEQAQVAQVVQAPPAVADESGGKRKKPRKRPTPKSALWRRLNQYFKECGGNETCWADQAVVRRSPTASKLVEKELRPRMPEEWLKDKHTWLTNFDIQDVMVQYESRYKSFRFMGVFPMDFAAPSDYGTGCVSDKMCNLNVADLAAQGVKQVAIILNLDKHTQSGSHLVAVYINFDKAAPRGRYGFFYYDSNAAPATKEVVALHGRLAAQVAALAATSTGGKAPRPFTLRYNTRRHQFGNSECGIFSMHFVERMLEGATFDGIMKAKEYDKVMNDLRNVYYRTPAAKAP